MRSPDHHEAAAGTALRDCASAAVECADVARIDVNMQ
jgi:hypothetical protein